VNHFDWQQRIRVPSCSPSNPRIAFIAEAPGENELRAGQPLVGASGQEFRAMCRLAGIDPDTTFRGNVISIRGNNSSFDEFLVGKRDQAALAGIAGDPPGGTLWDNWGVRNPIRASGYLHPGLWHELPRLHAELVAHRPNVICALGGIALWALAHTSAISKLRGATRQGSGPFREFKLVPSYHPMMVLRDWSLRPICVLDYMKVLWESAHAGIVRKPRRIVIVEHPQEILALLEGARRIAVDVETRGGTITSISFSPSSALAVVVPFTSADGSSTYSNECELELWKNVRRTLADRTREFIFQNGLYDIQYLWKSHGIPVPGAVADTMIAHHAMYPEMAKALGFLGSVYTDLPAWKPMRKQGKVQTEKADDA
jgi:uracil-DNA glycosylase